MSLYRKILFGALGLCAFYLGTLGLTAATVSLGQASDYTILIPEKATPQEKYSASLLAEYLKKLYGVQPGVKAESEPYSPPVIAVGETKLAKRNGFAKEIKPQGYCFSVKDRNLFIRGGEPGALNGVLSLLEDDLGCRWYTEEYKTPAGVEAPVSFIPNLSGKPLMVTPREVVPQFEMREQMFMYGNKQASLFPMLSRMAPISWHTFLPEESGGQLASILFIHTYASLLPAKKYHAEHPEYFALQDGKRVKLTHVFGSVCYTNPEVPKLMEQKIREVLKEHPTQRIFSISASDTSNAQCECDKCAPLIKSEGIMGAEVMLANKIAENLAKDYPDIRLTVLAYGGACPKTIRPHENVRIFFAPIQAKFNKVDMLRPLNEIERLIKPLDSWLNIGAKVYFWDYLDTSAIPFPTFDVYSDNIKYLARRGVAGYFADCTNGGVAFSPLKKWIYTKLLWNPELDLDPLIAEFVKAYYGPADTEMGEYLSMMRGAWRNFRSELAEKQSGVNLAYTPEQLKTMHSLMEKAMAKMPENRKGRIAREYLAVLAYELNVNPKVPGIEHYARNVKTAKRLLKYSPSNSFVRKNNKLPAKWDNKLRMAKAPQDKDAYSQNSVAVTKPTTVAGMSEYLDDAKALNGKASKHFGGKPWGIQWHYRLFKDSLIPGKTYVLRMRFRPELKESRDLMVFHMRAFHFANEPLNNKQPGLAIRLKAAECTKGYLWRAVCKVEFENPSAEGMYWMTSTVGKDEAVWYDRMEFVPLDEYKTPEDVPDTTVKL
jgi:hypothetical protein